MKRKIPIGVDDFKKIINENYFYVDKTKFIEEVISDGAEVKLFTRPRKAEAEKILLLFFILPFV